MRKTLTTTLALAACLMCSIPSLAQRTYIPEQSYPYYTHGQDPKQNQISDSVLRQLRALLGDEVADGVERGPQQNAYYNSNQNYYNNPGNTSNPNYPSNSNQNYSSNSNRKTKSKESKSKGSNAPMQAVEVITQGVISPSVNPYIEVNTQDPNPGQPTSHNRSVNHNSNPNAYSGNNNSAYSNSSTPSTYSNSSTYSAPSNPSGYSSPSVMSSVGQETRVPTNSGYPTHNNGPRVVIYPKIRATVGSEIIVEPGQATQSVPNRPWEPSTAEGQIMDQMPISSGMGGNVYVGNGGNGYNSYGYSQASANAPKVSELYTIVDGDTVSVILPQRNLGRFDRGLYNYLYIPKGRWAFGLTASYGEFNTEDVELLNIVKDFNFKGKLYSIKPFITYFFRNNQSMGMRLNYTRGEADLSSMLFDFDEDMSFDLKDISYYYEGYSMSVFYRNYVGLGRNSRFSVFNDIDLSFSSGSSRFKRYYEQVLRDTQTTTMGVALNFSPGVCVFIMDNAAFNVSFGVFGVSMHREKQVTNGVDEGSRFSSGANFKFNLFNINFGLMIVI